jgi:hypothetical protein
VLRKEIIQGIKDITGLWRKSLFYREEHRACDEKGGQRVSNCFSAGNQA